MNKSEWEMGEASFEADTGLDLSSEENDWLAEPKKKTGDAIKDAEADLSEIEKAFRERKKCEAERFKIATQSEYWFCVCFQSQEQKDAFLKAVGIYEWGDKYIDGVEWAKAQDIELPKVELQKKRR